MAQVTIYLPDELEAQARNAAEAQGTSLGKWIAGEVAETLRNTWPTDVLAAIGAFPDFPEADELRVSYAKDSSREPLI
jgi:hypothetical protein